MKWIALSDKDADNAKTRFDYPLNCPEAENIGAKVNAAIHIRHFQSPLTSEPRV